MKKEVWKDIIGYKGYYKVGNMGMVYSIKKNKILKGKIQDGYRRVELYKNGIRKTVTVHRLVGKAFLKKIKSKNDINHIDKNRLNNNVSNLEWVNNRENSYHRHMGISEFVGVVYHKKYKAFVGKIDIKKQRFFLGQYKEKEPAYLAYLMATILYRIEHKYLTQTP